MKTLLDYLKQESTWRGIVLIATVAGLQLAPDQQAAIISAGLGIVGVILAFRNDKTKTK